MRALVFDYGAGNLFSLCRALEHLGVGPSVERDIARCADEAQTLLVLPGVGAFGPAAERLAPARTRLAAQLAAGRPCLGICLGMQLMFSSSEEGPGQGLELFAGPVTRLKSRRCPHIGWTTVGEAEFYFAHSYACRPEDPSVVQATARFEEEQAIAAVVRRARTVGVQFHPEKSSRAGLELLRRVLTEVTS